MTTIDAALLKSSLRRRAWGRELGLQRAAASARWSGCLFCQVDNSAVNNVVRESRYFFARLDNFPATAGHVEVVPKRHVESFFDLSRREFRDLQSFMSEVRSYLDRAFPADGYNIGVNDGAAAGRTVHHLHIHLIPRRFGDAEDPRGGIRRGLPNGDPSEWTTPVSLSALSR